MSHINPLICSGSPRDIPDWLLAWDKLGLEADRYIAKYYPEKLAYENLQKYFLEHSQYTHMVIIPDDLIVRPSQFQQLKLDVERYEYPVLGGIFNRNFHDRRLWSCITDKFVRSWMTLPQIWYHTRKAEEGPIVRVLQDYFGCTFIRRDVIERIKFHGSPHSGFDWAFSLDCAKLDIPLHVDTRVKLLHLGNRKGDGTQENCGLGKYPSVCWLHPKRVKEF